ncbi:MAG TPA: adenylate/guanylate cyclase domain-containing protein [Candidatus Limnocylindrales bacterium]|nr:adenylate/guanylate cyclase domain-containing protein [Candidatus Limnocylindrales bacterium]
MTDDQPEHGATSSLAEAIADDPETTIWRGLLTGADPGLVNARRFWRRVPAAPRCKVCASPTQGVGGAIARVFWHGPMRNNPLLCKACFGQISQHPGGAEIEISVVFADVRGSTGLAERTSASAYRSLLQAYYRSAAVAIDDNGGIIDKFLGDGVMALFIPVITGENHAARAVAAGRAILAAVERDGLAARGLMVGAGVHTGEAFVGVVGSDEKTDFTALGDTVNIAARLGSLAGQGELLVSREAWERGGLGRAPSERQVGIAGRTGTMTVVATAAEPDPLDEEQPAPHD